MSGPRHQSGGGCALTRLLELKEVREVTARARLSSPARPRGTNRKRAHARLAEGEQPVGCVCPPRCTRDLPGSEPSITRWWGLAVPVGRHLASGICMCMCWTHVQVPGACRRAPAAHLGCSAKLQHKRRLGPKSALLQLALLVRRPA